MFDDKVMLAIGLVCVLLLYAAFELWKIEHKILAIIFFFSTLFILLLIPEVLYLNPNNCYNAMKNATTTPDGITTTTYQQQCYAQNTTVVDAFYNTYHRTLSLAEWYLLVMFLLLLFGEALKLTVMKMTNKWGWKKRAK